MPELLHPGLYFVENKGVSSVTGVGTSVAGFVGTAPKGKVRKPVYITSWDAYVKEFGGFDANSYLAYSVYNFFANGGSKCYVVRTVKYTSGTKTSAVATAQLQDASNNVYATVSAVSDGVWGNKLEVEIANYDATAKTFDFIVYEDGDIVEKFNGVTLDMLETLESAYVVVDVTDFGKTPKAVKVSLSGGNDGLSGISDSDYIDALQVFDEVKPNMIAIPGITSQAVQQGLIAYVENRKDCVAILDAPAGMKPTDVKTYVVSTAKLASEYAGFYYPWVKANDPIGVGKNPVKLLPPSGFVMGIIARTDNERGVWKAPAGIDAKVRNAIDVEYLINDAEQDLLNPNGINAIRVVEGEGICVWGARTLSKGEYKYLSVRRLAIFIQQSLEAGMKWVTFEPNDSVLWGKVQTAVEDFLNGIWSQGGLKGSTAKEAYSVRCDENLNTPDVVDQGITYCEYAIAPQKPNEFMVFKLGLKR